MSEAAPGLPDSPDFATPERARLAEAVRALIDAVMTTDGDDTALLLDVAAEAERLAKRLGGGRDAGAGYRPRSHGDYLPRSPVVGDASPLAPRIDWDVSDDALDGKPGIEAHGTFGAPYEGPPGYVHGGMIALAFDEVLGIANIAGEHPGMTARLTVLIPPVYLLVPQNQVVVSNGTFSASTVIRGNPAPFRFEWREISTVRASTVTSETTNFFTSGAITNKLPTVTNTWRLVVFNDAATTGVPFSFTVVALGDTDGDGIPDEWETAYGLNPNSNADRDLDSDGDGMSNLAEYMAGTNPTDSHSNLRVDLTTLPSAAMLQVGVAAGHTGSLQYSDALPGGPWLKLADFTARSTNRVEVIADPGYTNARFYRVVSPQQPGP